MPHLGGLPAPALVAGGCIKPHLPGAPGRYPGVLARPAMNSSAQQLGPKSFSKASIKGWPQLPFACIFPAKKRRTGGSS